MELAKTFTDDELLKIVEEAMLYSCSCPGQVAAEIRRLRELYRYQRDCQSAPGSHAGTHEAIATAAVQAHAALETCLAQVLTIEGWDRQTLKMPAGLRQRQADLLQPRG